MGLGRQLGLVAALLLTIAPAAAAPAEPLIPELFNPDHRQPQPDLGALKSIRFLTTNDFPPFHFALENGTLVGFDIDLARAICLDLKVACTIQAEPFTSLVGDLKAGKADALIAAIANNATTRGDLSFTAPYYTTPARFVARTSTALQAVTPESLTKRSVGAVAGTAHEAYLKTFFAAADLHTFHSEADLRAALQTGTIDVAFSEGIGLAIWLNDPASKNCCSFRGGPFTTSRFFGNGVSIAVGKQNNTLREIFDFELSKLTADGTYADLYLKYFPISFY